MKPTPRIPVTRVTCPTPVAALTLHTLLTQEGHTALWLVETTETRWGRERAFVVLTTGPADVVIAACAAVHDVTGRARREPGPTVH